MLPTPRDALYVRLKTKALGNQLAIAVGSSCSDVQYSLPSLGRELIQTFDLSISVNESTEFFYRWNDIVAEAETKTNRSSLIRFVDDIVRDAKPTPLHTKLANVPISNFVDTTFDRAFYKALVAVGRRPIVPVKIQAWD